MEASVIDNKSQCLNASFWDERGLTGGHGNWVNSARNWDNVGQAYLCLFQVATFKGWTAIMAEAIDTREVSVAWPIDSILLLPNLVSPFFISINLICVSHLHLFNPNLWIINGGAETFTL